MRILVFFFFFFPRGDCLQEGILPRLIPYTDLMLGISLWVAKPVLGLVSQSGPPAAV